MKNIFEIIRDAPDGGYNYENEYTQITNSYDYFLELALLWSFKLHSIAELDQFFQNVCSRLEYYFDSDIDELFEKITSSILNIDVHLHLYTIKKLEEFVINLNKGRIMDKINNECERYNFDKNKEIAKLIVLHYQLICGCFIATLNKDKHLMKQVGLFTPKVGIFKRQTPEKYLETLNSVTRKRVELYTNYVALEKDESKIEFEIEKQLPFRSIVERIWLYKALYSTK